jgi:uncharacterized membrane protein
LLLLLIIISYTERTEHWNEELRDRTSSVWRTHTHTHKGQLRMPRSSHRISPTILSIFFFSRFLFSRENQVRHDRKIAAYIAHTLLHAGKRWLVVVVVVVAGRPLTKPTNCLNSARGSSVAAGSCQNVLIDFIRIGLEIRRFTNLIAKIAAKVAPNIDKIISGTN